MEARVLCPELVDAEELSRILSINKRTIYDWALNGIIPCYRLGGLVRFSRAEIKDWLAQHAQHQKGQDPGRN